MGHAFASAKALTDMPLIADKLIDFGLTESCEQCFLCAKACPAYAIDFGERTMRGPTESKNPGNKKWNFRYECDAGLEA